MKNLNILDKIIVGRVDPYIYAFTTNTVPNYLKIGDTYRPVQVRLNEWKKYYPELKQEFEEKAIVNENVFFRDYSVHKFIEEELGKIRLLENDLEKGIYYSNEFFKDTTSEEVEEAINDIKKNYEENTTKYQYYNSKDLLPVIHHYASTGMCNLRPNQEEAVEKFKIAVEHGRKNLLMYAVMRFGKSFTSLMCAKEINAKIVLVVSAKADVKEEWKKTVESADNLNSDYVFLSSNELIRNSHIIEETINNKGVVIFLTLQDLQGDIIKEKHKELFEKNIDLLIIDETHFGARAEKYGQVLRNTNYESDIKDKYSDDYIETEEALKYIKILNAKVRLHLSGTPYRILMGSEFSKEDIISFCQFSDIVKAQNDWDKENVLNDNFKEWENPYYGFPQMIRFAFNPSSSAKEKLKEYKKNGFTYAFSSLFKPVSIKKNINGNHKKFINENEILELFEVIDGSKTDDNLLGFLDYDKIKEGKMCRHIVCVLPYCASCDALEQLIKNNHDKFKNLNEYEIINISGVENTNLYKTTNDVKQKINECEKNNIKTITLTVNRMLTGSTVQEWDTMLYFKDTASPQEYDQSIFRLQNQYIKEFINDNGDVIKYNMKPQTLLVDFDPERMFLLQETKSLIYNVNTEEAGNALLRERINNELKISPIITINKDKIVEITPEDIMAAVSNYSKEKGVLDETNEIPVDLSLLQFEEIKKVIEKQSELGSKKGLFVETAEGEGEELDIPETQEVEFPDGGTEDDYDDKNNKVVNSDSNKTVDPIKQFRTYYARILFYSFLTKDKVISLDDIIENINSEDNSRIAYNLGLDKNILLLIRKNINLFILSQLDYKIQNINNLSNDSSLEPITRAMIAVSKFSKLSESEFITSPSVCKNVINLITNDELRNVVSNNGKILDVASKMAEFPISLYTKLTVDLGINPEQVKDRIYAIPTSNIAYEFTRKIYEILDLNTKNIACKFNSYNLIDCRKDNDELDIHKITTMLSQNKNFDEIELEENLFTQEGENLMKFDLIVGNPPYQVSDGGALASAKPIYQYFVNVSNSLSSRFTSLIIPTRWFVGGKGLDDFRVEMLNDNHLKELHDYLTPEDVFPNTNIRGGVCYFLRDNQYDNSENLVKVVTHENNNIIYELNRPLKTIDYDVFIRDSKAKSIIDKVIDDKFISMSTIVSSRKPFGLDGNFARTNKFKMSIEQLREPICCYAKGKRLGFIERDDILTHDDWINKWKVFIPRANNIGTELNDDNMNSFVGKPDEVCTESYLSIGAELNLNEESSENLSKYFKTKFLRYLHGLLKSSQDATSKTFDLVPLQDFTTSSFIDWSKSIKEIDSQLYKKYNLSNEEIIHIESKIKEM